MHPRIQYLRLLEEVNQRFEEPDWPTIRAWLESEAGQERVRQEGFVPTTVTALQATTEPSLQPGDTVRSPILTRQPDYRVPPRTTIDASLHALGSVTVGEGAILTSDLLAADEIRWQGGAGSVARNLVAPRIHISTPPGTVLGGLWCDELACDSEGADLAPGLTVQGMVVVDEPAGGKLVVGAGSSLGGLYVRAGEVESQQGVTISHLQARDAVRLGRDNRAGYVEASAVNTGSRCHLGVVVSGGPVVLGKESAVDTIRARGDITLAEGVTVTGPLLLSEGGSFQIPTGGGWHSDRAHWFYVLPGDELRPYQEGAGRPEGSQIMAIQSLTHALWMQMERLAGRE